MPVKSWFWPMDNEDLENKMVFENYKINFC